MAARDLIGYADKPPDPLWPGGARIALQFVVNYEEGAERTVMDGDDGSEAYLTEIVGAAPVVGGRSLSSESVYEFGSRVGIWRVLRLFEDRGFPFTLFAVGLALDRNPAVAEAAVRLGCDVVGHGLRWIDHAALDLDTERQHMARTSEIIERLTGRRPLGWYAGRLSINTRRLVREAGFLYDSDSYADELPYWDADGDAPHLVVPYTMDVNDQRFSAYQGFPDGDSFFGYLRDSFDFLYREGQRHPRMMSVGLHPRLVGRPGRAEALSRFLDYVGRHKDVWICRREDVARHWYAMHRPSGRAAH